MTLYFSKKDINDGFLYSGKTSYCQHRGITRSALHKRPFKIKDTLKELEGYLLQNKVVCSSWENNKLQLLLSRGILVIITLNTNSIVSNISFNKSLSTKIQTELICDGVISGQQIVCACTDGRILCQGGVWKDGWIIDGGTKRRVSLTGELLCIWGRVNADHPQPWSPLLKDHQKANLLLYMIEGNGPELQAHKKTEGEPIDVIISKRQNKILFTVEQKVSLRGAVCVEFNTLELTKNTLSRIAVTSVPLQTQVCCCALSYNEKRLVLGCIDGSVALFDRIRGSTHMIKTSIIPTFAVWHKGDAVVVFSNKKGQLQYFDTALNRINTQSSAEDCMPGGLLDLSCYFNVQPDVSCMNWGRKDLIVLVDHGPLVVITHLEASLSFTSLIKQYLKMRKIKQAIGVLLSWEWNDECFSALQRIVAHLLKLPLTEENAHNLQNSLSSFHNSPVPLSTSIKHKYGSQVRALTRRFFHQLVRYKIFETAFLLAVDIGHHDLFMDLYYCATSLGEKEMAAAARAQASALLSRCSSEASFCSRSACSQCSDSFIDSSNESSLQENQDKLSFSSSELSPPASTAFNDNFLTTNFNGINPKTYRTDLTCHDTDVSKSAIFSKPFIYKTTPFSQSSTFSGSIAAFNPVIKTPPLPIARPLPTASSLINKHYPVASSITSMIPNCASIAMSTVGNSPALFNNAQLWGSYTSANIASSDMVPTIETDSSIQNLPISYSLSASCSITMTTTQTTPSQSASHVPSQPTNVNHGKKPQAKVKFSDTVTAFIVPEVKRPIRPPPPPHITDPQKELADSLPLCHPNEDYLKDFTPAKSHDADELSTQPKIKVVHFGVV